MPIRHYFSVCGGRGCYWWQNRIHHTLILSPPIITINTWALVDVAGHDRWPAVYDHGSVDLLHGRRWNRGGHWGLGLCPYCKHHRIDIDLTSIRRFRVGSMSNRCRFQGQCYLGFPVPKRDARNARPRFNIKMPSYHSSPIIEIRFCKIVLYPQCSYTGKTVYW